MTQDPRNPAASASSSRAGWPRAAASIAVFKGDHILIARRGKPPVEGKWSLPGGHIEPGETVATAALRELDEETGIQARIVGLVDVHDVIIRDAAGDLAAHYLIAVHAGIWLGGEPVGRSDIVEARFVPIAELSEFDMTSGAAALAGRAHRMVESIRTGEPAADNAPAVSLEQSGPEKT